MQTGSRTQRFYRVVYRLEKGVDTGVLVARVAEVVAASGSPDHPISFLFTDPVLRGRSAIEYLIKTYPAFEPYRRTADFPLRAGPMVTNILPDGTVNASVPAETLVEVARGIPRRFPFGFATFAWRDVPALDLTPELPAADATAAGMQGRILGRTAIPIITLASAWGASKRGLDLTAVVRFSADGEVGRKPVLPAVTEALLDALGKRRTHDVYALPTTGESAEKAKEHLESVQEVFMRARMALSQRLAELRLEPLESMPGPAFENPGSVRDPLAEALRPLGYEPLAGAGAPGLLVFAKRLDNGDELRVSVDRGTWSHHFAPRLEIRTEQWVRSMAVPLAPGDVAARSYQQVDQENIRRLCANTARVVAEIERTVYPEVRAVLS